MRAILGLFAFVLLVPFVVSADVTIRPFLIDETLTQRESATNLVKIQNSYETRKVVLFPTVNEITVGTEGDIVDFVTPSMTDRTVTPTSWVDVTRGRVEVMPGESAEVPVKITAHPKAEPGEYHLFIGFTEARNRPLAEEKVLAGKGQGVIVKVTIADERVDSMKIASMQIDRFVTNPDKQSVEVTIENPGEIASAPNGELIFYNSRGLEVGAARVNETEQQIQPGASQTFTVPVPIDSDVGRFKANLNMRYGAGQQASLYDSTTFFMMPMWFGILFVFGFLSLAGLLVVLFRRALATGQTPEHGDVVTMYVRDGHDPNPLDHDIDLSEKK